jgi:hypothetical protein
MDKAPIKEITEKAKAELKSLTGFPASSVISVKQNSAPAAEPGSAAVELSSTAADGEETWKVVVELLERTGIPDRMDILGIYEAKMDAQGNLVSYERKGLRKRGDTAGQEAEEIE